MKIKCSQCGCEDLEKVDFPYKVILETVEEGLAGESSFYDIHEKNNATSYICTKCGHFEFFNPELAKFILEKRAKIIKIQEEIDNLGKQILNKNNEIENHKKQINLITEQLKNIDITIGQSIELKTKQQELSENLKSLEKDVKSLCKQQKNLKNVLKA